MPRKGPVAKRDLLLGPMYNSKLVTGLINKMMGDGRKCKSQRILYNAYEIVSERTRKEPMYVLEKGLKSIIPVL